MRLTGSLACSRGVPWAMTRRAAGVPLEVLNFRIDRLHTIEGDGGHLFVETETGGDADGQFGGTGRRL